MTTLDELKKRHALDAETPDPVFAEWIEKSFDAMNKPEERDIDFDRLRNIVIGEVSAALTQIERDYARRDCWQQFDYLLARLKVDGGETALRTTMQQVLIDAQAQDVLVEWWPMMERALGHNATLRGDSGFIAGVPLESTVRTQEVE